MSIANRQEPNRLNSGISQIGKRAVVPRGVRIGRNVKIAAGVRAVDFRSKVVRSGGSVEPRRGTDADAVLAVDARRSSSNGSGPRSLAEGVAPARRSAGAR